MNVPTPPPYVVSLVGPAPEHDAARRQWETAIAAIEAYRRRWGVDHPTSALGKPVGDPVQAAERQATEAILRRYQRALLAREPRHVLDDDHARTIGEAATGPKLPLQPLLRSLRLDAAEPAGPRDPGRFAKATTVLGLSKRTLQRYWHTGVDVWTADRLAIAAGLHPRIVWGESWDRAVSAMEQERQARPACEISEGRRL